MAFVGVTGTAAVSRYRPSRSAWGALSVLLLLTTLMACGGDSVVQVPEGGGGATTSSSGTGGQSDADIRITISDVTVGINCMPEVSPDPVSVSFSMLYDNALGTENGSATIEAARVIFSDGASSTTWTYDVEPPGSGTVPAGGFRDVDHAKTDDSGSGSGALPCSYCSASSAGLDLEIRVGGAVQIFSASSDQFGCSY